jgi:hypothetical protein
MITPKKDPINPKLLTRERRIEDVSLLHVTTSQLQTDETLSRDEC